MGSSVAWDPTYVLFPIAYGLRACVLWDDLSGGPKVVWRGARQLSLVTGLIRLGKVVRWPGPVPQG